MATDRESDGGVQAIRESAANAPLNDSMLTDVAAVGYERAVERGDVLYRAGDATPPFIVVLEGEVEVLRVEGAGELIVASRGPGGFLGELNLLTGQRIYLTSRVSRSGRVLVVEPDDFRQLLSSKPELSDTIFRAFVARRELLRSGDGAGAIQIIGSRYSPEAMALRAFANRSRLAHTWIDVDEIDDAPVFLASLGAHPRDVPLVITPTARLRRPSPGEFAQHLGLTYRAVPGYLADLVVVGTGPAGLAASVYGASEGLTTISLDAVGPGGQAGASSRIENYVGFPNGVSGEDLVARTAIQAMRLGAHLNAPCEVMGLRADGDFHVVALTDGSELSARAVILATGAHYRRLDVEDLERFEGAGVYYAATELEARVCAGSNVIVVGGGNSAGQAALFLAQQGSPVALVIRRRDLADTMSHYLIERIDADPRIDVLSETEVRTLAGVSHLERVTVEHNPSGRRTEIQSEGLFCFIGAIPATGWLDGTLAVDRSGFLLTDRSLPKDAMHSTAFLGREPLPFETSVPGVFAVGDVRSGSMKRVAAAVGEGSSAVRSVHDYLAVQHGDTQDSS
ncbi:MAG: thioredoxin reductase [Acidimicrobiaceae bacterium]|jgi:thioredoxin reductase (NADPH)